ncbi:hypothetical protein SDJN02_08533, partial [Cucurbita argyrosperma subsp. argyrosperma]
MCCFTSVVQFSVLCMKTIYKYIVYCDRLWLNF